jgi:probable HAF family extracellular repeat protein
MSTPGYSRTLTVGIAATVLAALLATSGSAASMHASWRIVDLGTLGSAVAYASEADAINAHGDVIGNSWNRSGTRTRAFIWRSGRLVPLGTLGGESSQAQAINGHGQVVGWAETSSDRKHAFLWEKGHMRDLGVPPGTDQSDALGITNSGLVVGVASKAAPVGVVDLGPANHGHLVVWQSDGRIRDLGRPWNPNPDTATWVSAVNEHGQITGTTVPDHVGERSFLWDGRNLRTLPPRNARSKAVDINEAAQVTGWTYRGDFRAATWKRGQMHLLPRAAGRPGAFTNAINDKGDVVGYNWANRWADDHAILWRNGTAIDLGTLGGTQSEANEINNHRQIVGISETSLSDSQSPVWHVFLWQGGRMVDLGSGTPIAINVRGEIIGSSAPYGSLNPGHARVWVPNEG